MKIIKTICFLTFCLFMITACGSETETSSQKTPPTTQTATKKKAVPHDHDGDGVPDHGPGEHDHAGHSHATEAKQKTVSPEEMAKRKAIQAKREKEKKEPPTAAQKATADKLCACLKAIPSLSKVAKAKDQAAFDKAAAGKIDEVKAMQQCHNKIVTADLKNIPAEDQGIYAFKARKAANQSCLNREGDDLWFMMGKYIATFSGPAGKANVKKNIPKAIQKGN